MSVIRKFLIWTSNSAALWTFLLFYVTVMGKGKTAGQTMYGTPINLTYSFELCGFIIGFMILSYLFSKIRHSYSKDLDGFWGLVTPVIWVALTCGAGLCIMYEVSLFVEP